MDVYPIQAQQEAAKAQVGEKASVWLDVCPDDSLASGQRVFPPELHARVDTGRYACRRSRYRMSAGRDFSETAQPSAAFGTDDRAHQEKGSFEGEYERLLKPAWSTDARSH